MSFHSESLLKGPQVGEMGMQIDGQTALVGVIGWPVAHSLSPLMHNTVFAHLGLNWCYVPLPVDPRDLKRAVAGLVVAGFRGFNVTVPHKQAVFALVDTLTPEARAVGAVNTVAVKRDAAGCISLEGHNTDVAGFIGDLRSAGFQPGDDVRAMVIGAGGAARAVVFGLLHAGVRDLLLVNRTLTRAHSLAQEMCERFPAARLEVRAWSADIIVESADRVDLLVNTTTLGMWPDVEGSPWPSGHPIPQNLTVYDLVYNPLETSLLHTARTSGARAISGIGMLARQGALALARWVPGPVDIDAVAALMKKACVAQLSHREATVCAHHRRAAS